MTSRPAPVGRTESGIDVYSGEEFAAWRASRGITQEQVAVHLKVARPYIARLESDRHGLLSVKNAERLMKAVDFLVAVRDKMAAEGTTELARIRARSVEFADGFEAWTGTRQPDGVGVRPEDVVLSDTSVDPR